MTVRDEQSYSPAVGKLATLLNRRLTTRPCSGLWVRIRPPDREEAAQVQANPWYLPFLRVGSLGTVVEDLGGFIDFSIAGTRILISTDVFLSTWIKAVEESQWKPTPPSKEVG